ncbi:MAG TPA: LacI family DNA-binding transcriptional regulator [Actinocrinis sp.]|uniref:LacI family DNA-binding transcriptional regulator n=1 Tax=Actinocrinis sp. TaxID=1920516 RepID=UPI002DDCC6C3|nr:LacI family DNA-binding transcriptional regulator [Actinocrinis sp.]HEV3172514.1 LacI family DNA-binding transcriptional regulator [Actinocrinis sp.]
MRGVTLTDVALRAGVSQPTASRVLNGSARRPSPAVVEAVRRAADELGYISNAQAQALARSQTGLVGLVVHDIADPYFSSIAAGVQAEAYQRDRQVLLATTLRSTEQEIRAVNAFIGHRTDAIVLVGSRLNTDDGLRDQERLTGLLDRYRGLGGRVAVIGQPLPGTHTIAPDNRAGAAALAKALTAEADAPRQFVVLAGPPKLATAVDRTAGFLRELRREGIKPLAVVPGEFTRDGGYEAAQQVVASLNPQRRWGACIFAVNDVMALGAIAALREAGLRTPRDVQVAGFDDIPTLRDHEPGLTTVALPLQEMGRRAIEMALASDTGEQSVTRVSGRVIMRESTNPTANRAEP